MSRIKLLLKITAMTSVSLAIAFAFSCSSTDIPDLPSEHFIGEAPSSSSIGKPSSSSEVSSSSSISQSSSSSNIDYYDTINYGNQTYKTVKIGEQTWIAENLNLATSSGRYCEESNCNMYGNLYNWAEAMNLPSSCNSTSCSDSVKTNHQGICPDGWHIPSNADWDRLFRFIDGTNGTSPYSSPTAGRYLKAQKYWNDCGPSSSESLYLCEDSHGFAAMPGGFNNPRGNYYPDGDDGYWWSSSEGNANAAYNRRMYYNSENAIYDIYSKNLFLSVRCLKDESELTMVLQTKTTKEGSYEQN